MIISASRRTDIPAYFGNKFYNNLISGEFIIVNPFNNRKKELNLKKSEIDGIVFWTKNPFPFFKYLKKIKDEGFKFYFQYTMNNYPEYIEPLKYSLNQRVSHLKELYDMSYPNKIVLRYDPIILTEKFNINFHYENFELIMENCHKFVDKAIISFVTVYKKIRKILNGVIDDREHQFRMLEKISEIGKKFSKRVEICCYNEDVKEFNIYIAKCIDASYFGIKGEKHQGQRKLCNCDKSVDIGFYHTCKTGCIYCYAK